MKKKFGYFLVSVLNRNNMLSVALTSKRSLAKLITYYCRNQRIVFDTSIYFFLFSFILSKISEKNYKANFKLEKKSETKHKQSFSHKNFKKLIKLNNKPPNWCNLGGNKIF